MLASAMRSRLSAGRQVMSTFGVAAPSDPSDRVGSATSNRSPVLRFVPGLISATNSSMHLAVFSRAQS